MSKWVSVCMVGWCGAAVPHVLLSYFLLAFIEGAGPTQSGATTGITQVGLKSRMRGKKKGKRHLTGQGLLLLLFILVVVIVSLTAVNSRKGEHSTFSPAAVEGSQAPAPTHTLLDGTGSASSPPSAAASSIPFRCRKPLSSSTAWKHSDGQQHPCDFQFFQVSNALVTLQHYSDRRQHSFHSTAVAAVESPLEPRDSVSEEAESPSTTVTVELEMVTAQQIGLLFRHRRGVEAGSTGDEGAPEEEDPWRFSLSLLFRGASSSGGPDSPNVIHYRGFNRNGYSMCCGLLVSREDGAYCSWRVEGEEERGAAKSNGSTSLSPHRSTRYLHGANEAPRCPLPYSLSSSGIEGVEGVRDSDDRLGGVPFLGSITKPLPFDLKGKWEARIQFWRARSSASPSSDVQPSTMDDESSIEMLGRVIIPFQV